MVLKVTDIQTSADEPLWTVNIKKAIASQLQVDVGGIRSTEEVKSDYSSTEESNIASNIYEVEMNIIKFYISYEVDVGKFCDYRMVFLVAAALGTR